MQSNGTMKQTNRVVDMSHGNPDGLITRQAGPEQYERLSQPAQASQIPMRDTKSARRPQPGQRATSFAGHPHPQTGVGKVEAHSGHAPRSTSFTAISLLADNPVPSNQFRVREMSPNRSIFPNSRSTSRQGGLCMVDHRTNSSKTPATTYIESPRAINFDGEASTGIYDERAAVDAGDRDEDHQ